jgi:integrase
MQLQASRRSRRTVLDKVDGLVKIKGAGETALYFIRVKDGRSETGKLLYKKFGPVTEDRIPEIDAKARAYAKARAEEQKPRVLGKLHKRTLGEWLEIWLEDVVRVGQSASTYDHYKFSVGAYLIKNSIAQVALVDLDQERIGKWRRELEARGVGRATINYALARLKAALEVAIEPSRLANNGIRINMARKLVPLKVKEKQPYVGSHAETRLVAEAIGPNYMQALVQVATDLGLRRSETAALQWGDFDLDGGTVTIKRHLVISGSGAERTLRIVDGTKTSAGKWHTLNLSDRSVAALHECRQRLLEHKVASGKAWKADQTSRAIYVDTANHRTGTPYVVPSNPVADDALVFPYWDGMPWDPTTLGNWFVRQCNKVGVKGKSIHDLRHDCATFLIGAGVPLTVVADHMRHKDASLTAKVYSHLLASQDRLAVSTFNRIWADVYADAAQAV